jgi:hypothetical protein
MKQNFFKVLWRIFFNKLSITRIKDLTNKLSGLKEEAELG